MDSVLTLHHAVDDQDRLAVGDLAVLVVDLWLDGDVDLTELVLEGEETDVIGGGGSLAGDDQAGDADALPAADLRDFVGFERAHRAQALAAEMDEVVAGREVGDAVLELVGVEVVDARQLGRGGVEAELGLPVDSLA